MTEIKGETQEAETHNKNEHYIVGFCWRLTKKILKFDIYKNMLLVDSIYFTTGITSERHNL